MGIARVVVCWWGGVVSVVCGGKIGVSSWCCLGEEWVGAVCGCCCCCWSGVVVVGVEWLLLLQGVVVVVTGRGCCCYREWLLNGYCRCLETV